MLIDYIGYYHSLGMNLIHNFNWLNEQFVFWIKPYDDGGLFRFVFQNCNLNSTSIFTELTSITSWLNYIFLSKETSPSSISCYTKRDKESSRYSEILLLSCLAILFLPILSITSVLLIRLIKLCVYRHFRRQWCKTQSNRIANYCNNSNETISIIDDSRIISPPTIGGLNEKYQYEEFLHKKMTNLCERHQKKFAIALSMTGFILMCLVLAGCIHMNISFQQLRKSLDSESVKSNYSLPRSVNSAFLNVLQFMTVGLKEGSYITQEMVGNIESGAKVHINETVVDFGNRLLNKFGVSRLLIISKTLSESLNETLDSMEYIMQYGGNLFNSLHEFEGVMDINKQILIDNLKALCRNTAHYGECQVLEQRLTYLNMPIEQNLILFDSSRQMKFLKEKMNIDMVNVVNRLRATNRHFENLIFNTYSILGQKLYFQLDPNNDINNLLKDANSTLENVSADIMYYKNTLVSYINLYASIQHTLFSFFISILLLSSIFLSLYFILLIYYYIQQLKSKKTSRLYTLGIIQSNWPNRTIIVLIITSILLTVFPIVHVVLSSLLKTEVCRPTFTTYGVNNSDTIINRFVSSHWPKWITELNASFNISFELRLQPPKEILYGLMWKCSLPKTGLFSAFNIDGVVDADQVIKSKKLLDLIKEGEIFAHDFIKTLDDTTILNQSEKDVFKNALQFTVSFDEKNYEPSIKTLNQSITNISNPSGLLADLRKFAEHFSDVDNSRNMIEHNSLQFDMYLLTQLPLLKEEIENLMKKFLIIQRHRTFTSQIKDLLKSVAEVELLLSDLPTMSSYIGPIYHTVTQELLEKLKYLLLTNVNYLEKTIAQCQPLNSAITQFLHALCHENNFTENSLQFGLITLLWLLPFYIFLIIVWYSPDLFLKYYF